MRNRATVKRVEAATADGRDVAVPAPGRSGRLPRRRLELTDALRTTLWTTGFVAAHVPLAVLIDSNKPNLATAHAVVTLACGLWLALSGELEHVALVIGYIAGAEVLWRMTGAQVNWEFGKYAAAGIMILALVRRGRLRPPLLPILYFALLLPSTWLTLSNHDFRAARDQISFNLSGPFALMVAAWFFSKIQLSQDQVRTVFVAVIAPIVGVATLAALGAFGSSDIAFSDSSNLISSGGFGPNQVSAVLGFGALLALFICVQTGTLAPVRVVMASVIVGLGAQSALTFSRGGLYMAAGGAAVAALFAVKDARVRWRLLPLVAVILVVGNYLVLPYLNAFTNGEIGARFEDVTVTGRDRLIQADLDLWKDNPLFGVGPGEGRLQRGNYFLGSGSAVLTASPVRAVAAHTEFSRLLSEHGTFGLVALVIFVAAGFLNVLRSPDPRTRAVTAGLVCWGALYMGSNAMRVLAPSFAYGMAFAAFVGQDGRVWSPAARGRRRPGHVRPLTEGHPLSKRRLALLTTR